MNNETTHIILDEVSTLLERHEITRTPLGIRKAITDASRALFHPRAMNAMDRWYFITGDGGVLAQLGIDSEDTLYDVAEGKSATMFSWHDLTPAEQMHEWVLGSASEFYEDDDFAPAYEDAA